MEQLSNIRSQCCHPEANIALLEIWYSYPCILKYNPGTFFLLKPWISIDGDLIVLLYFFCLLSHYINWTLLVIKVLLDIVI